MYSNICIFIIETLFIIFIHHIVSLTVPDLALHFPKFISVVC